MMSMPRTFRTLLPAVACACAITTASAGVLHGLDARSLNGVSGHRIASHVQLGRDGYFGLVCNEGASSGSRRAVHPLDLPSGHALVSVTIWGLDESPSNDLRLRLRESCQPYLQGALPVTTTLAEASTSGAAGDFAIALFPTLDAPLTATCTYFIESRFAQDTSACAGPALVLTRIRTLTLDPDVIFRDGFES